MSKRVNAAKKSGAIAYRCPPALRVPCARGFAPAGFSCALSAVR